MYLCSSTNEALISLSKRDTIFPPVINDSSVNPIANPTYPKFIFPRISELQKILSYYKRKTYRHVWNRFYFPFPWFFPFIIPIPLRHNFGKNLLCMFPSSESPPYPEEKFNISLTNMWSFYKLEPIFDFHYYFHIHL